MVWASDQLFGSALLLLAGDAAVELWFGGAGKLEGEWVRVLKAEAGATCTGP